jgi:glycopeptide antibiotics resistance protein
MPVLTATGLWRFATGPATVAVCVAVLAVAWPLGRRIAERCRCPRTVAVLFVVAAGLILALTLTPSEPGAGLPQPPHFVHQLGHPRLVWATITAAPGDAEQWANIALYLPLGFLGRFVWRSAARASGFGLALTAFVETCQYGIVGRAGSITDIRNNTAGAVLGALAAATTARLLRRAAPARPPAG